MTTCVLFQHIWLLPAVTYHRLRFIMGFNEFILVVQLFFARNSNLRSIVVRHQAKVPISINQNSSINTPFRMKKLNSSLTQNLQYSLWISLCRLEKICIGWRDSITLTTQVRNTGGATMYSTPSKCILVVWLHEHAQFMSRMYCRVKKTTIARKGLTALVIRSEEETCWLKENCSAVRSSYLLFLNINRFVLTGALSG